MSSLSFFFSLIRELFFRVYIFMVRFHGYHQIFVYKRLSFFHENLMIEPNEIYFFKVESAYRVAFWSRVVLLYYYSLFWSFELISSREVWFLLSTISYMLHNNLCQAFVLFTHRFFFGNFEISYTTFTFIFLVFFISYLYFLFIFLDPVSVFEHKWDAN